ncbi:MAG: TerB family tellurite resistance protein [Planctomycetota bacterium]|nr:TerB family tellurite resistance protein [Planctomycetota bacterium]
MNQAEQDAVVTVCLLAAFADGRKGDAEREEVRRIVDNLDGDPTDGPPGGRGLSALYQDVLLGRVSVEKAVRPLTRPEHRTLAYEMAVAVCDADGKAEPEERAFLEKLRAALSIDTGSATAALDQADELMDLGLEPPQVAAKPVGLAAAGVPAAGVPVAGVNESEIDSSITKYAILNAAIELLPQGLATAAIIPLQMKMVYRIGARYGFTLSTGHIKDFLATVGVGMTSQVIENYARKFLGGLGRRVLGRIGGAVADQATSSAFSFATTYALGHAAKAYYAGGRSLGAIDLKTVFTSQAEKAKSLYAQHRGAIEAQSKGLDASRLLTMVRQGI